MIYKNIFEILICSCNLIAFKGAAEVETSLLELSGCIAEIIAVEEG
jgi:hypothetical protein